jgi:hypothetical protein
LTEKVRANEQTTLILIEQLMGVTVPWPSKRISESIPHSRGHPARGVKKSVKIVSIGSVLPIETQRFIVDTFLFHARGDYFTHERISQLLANVLRDVVRVTGSERDVNVRKPPFPKSDVVALA